MSTYVLVPGAWHGGWCWQAVAATLRDAGHDVHAPTLTGLAERSHLLGVASLATHVDDVATLVEFHDARDLVLVGHSYSGAVVTGAAAKLGARVRAVVVIDGLLPEVGDAAIDILPPEAASGYREAGAAGTIVAIPPPPLANLGVTDRFVLDAAGSLLTPQPLQAYLDESEHGASGLDIDGLYILCTGWGTPFARHADHAEELGWTVRRLDTGHEVMLTDPALVAEQLLSV